MSSNTQSTSNSSSKSSNRSSSNSKSMLSKVSDKLPAMSGKQKAAAAGIAAAAVAGVAAHRMRKSRSKNNSPDPEKIYHLQPHGEGWQLTLEDSTGIQASFETKEEGLAAARALASENGPSELVIHRTDGSEQTRHQYA